MRATAPWRHSLIETQSRRHRRGHTLIRMAALAALILMGDALLSRCALAQEPKRANKEDRILMWCDLDAGPSGECFRVGRAVVRTQCRDVAKTMNERRDERLRIGVSPGFVALCIVDTGEK